MKGETMSEYANSMLGTAALALANLEYAQGILGRTGIAAEERAILSGRCQAYRTILTHITGIAEPPETCCKRWQGWIDSAPQH